MSFMPMGNSGAINIDNIGSILSTEILGNANIRQSAETGHAGSSNINSISNKLFGAPFQLLDSVDARLDTVNPNVGSEYLRNFLINSPVLYIKPGMPRYTGGDDPTGMLASVGQSRAVRLGQEIAGLDVSGMASGYVGTLLRNKTAIGTGSNLQKRMFGFRETYVEYMQYVNYMCRSVAILMGLPAMAQNGLIPNGAFTVNGFEPFQTIRWENYRMSERYVKTVWEQMKSLASGIKTDIGSFLGKVANERVSKVNVLEHFNPLKKNSIFSEDTLKSIYEDIDDNAPGEPKEGVLDYLRNRITNVQFMVEPTSFSETLSNETGKSLIEEALSGISEGLGSEIAFMTNASIDTTMAGDIMKFVGDKTSNVALSLNDLASSVTGGFARNLFSGAIGSLKGQKMIYPEIYKRSAANIAYNFKLTLSTPYGDPYNYYMHIVVPLLHLVGLVAPRMLTSNTIASPFLVQAFIPGMCTCELGIISNLTITKNPRSNHVSVHGFPLTIDVDFSVQPLYRNISISPAHDPASFMFNETLNDYLANLAGLVPSIDTYALQQSAMFENLSQYFQSPEQWFSDVVSNSVNMVSSFLDLVR